MRSDRTSHNMYLRKYKLRVQILMTVNLFGDTTALDQIITLGRNIRHPPHKKNTTFKR